MAFGACILDAEGLRLSPEEKALFREVDPFGFILFARNIDTPDQVRALCDDLRESVGREALITVDQEGGRVQRLRAPHWREWPAPRDVAQRAGDDAAEAMYLIYRIIAAELHALGIDSNCAPMVDVLQPDTHEFLLSRCYGADVGRIAELGRSVASGLMDGGVLPVMKHMPGHGRAPLDSHFDLPRVTASRDVLQSTDFAPFRALSDLPMGMTSHVVFEAIDDQPATLSAKLLQVMRDDIGFQNLIMTDDMSMKALQGSDIEKCCAAHAAGCDAILYCNQPLADRRAVAEAVGRMTPEAQARAEQALAMRKTSDDVDIPALERKLNALLGGTLHG